MQLAQINFDQVIQESGVNFEISQTSGTFGDIISRALPVVFFAAGVAFLLYLISGGFKLMTSAGDPKKIESGKKIIMNAIVGFIIIFVSFWIVRVLGLVFGIEDITKIF